MYCPKFGSRVTYTDCDAANICFDAYFVGVRMTLWPASTKVPSETSDLFSVRKIWAATFWGSKLIGMCRRSSCAVWDNFVLAPLGKVDVMP